MSESEMGCFKALWGVIFSSGSSCLGDEAAATSTSSFLLPFLAYYFFLGDFYFASPAFLLGLDCYLVKEIFRPVGLGASLANSRA